MEDLFAIPRTGIDSAKLDILRDKHARLHGTYKAAAERARDLANDASLLMMEISVEADAELAPSILARTAEALATTTGDELAAAKLSSNSIRRLAAAKSAVARQRLEVAKLSVQLRESTQLMNNLNEYAKRFEVLL